MIVGFYELYAQTRTSCTLPFTFVSSTLVLGFDSIYVALPTASAATTAMLAITNIDNPTLATPHPIPTANPAITPQTTPILLLY